MKVILCITHEYCGENNSDCNFHTVKKSIFIQWINFGFTSVENVIKSCSDNHLKFSVVEYVLPCYHLKCLILR